MAVAVTVPGAPTEGLEEIALLGSLFPYQCQAGAGHYTTNRERGRSYWGVERRELSQGACAQTLPPGQGAGGEAGRPLEDFQIIGGKNAQAEC